MSIVGRKGKLSLNPSLTASQEIVWQRLEDALTADVFGAYRYLSPAIGLLPFLRHASDENRRSLSEFLQTSAIPWEELHYARILL